MRRRTALALGLLLGLTSTNAAADDFAAGSLIIPMDTDYQDLGIFEAYGLVYELLKKGVPVRWVIKVGKQNGGVDFMATSTDVRTGDPLEPHGYRGGPWVIDSAHLFAECQAVNAFENLDPHGFFLTTKGFLIGQGPNTYDYFQADSPFAQIDGAFGSVGGSEPAYSLPMGETYKAGDTVLITQGGTPVGVNDVWMSGFIDGVCPGFEDDPNISALCLTAGKVSYLGGHEYSVTVPISANPKSQGVRLFLNSLFEAPCATAEGLPQPQVIKSAPAIVNQPQITYDIQYSNEGAMTALNATLTDTLPAGVTFVSATDNGVYANGEVTWELGNLGEGEGGMVSVTVDLDAPGVYVNHAAMLFHAGVNELMVESAPAMTEYDPNASTDTDSGGGSSGTDSAGTGSGGSSGSASASAGSDSATASASGTGDSASGTGASASAGSDSATGGSATATGGSATATATAGETGGDSASSTAGGDESGGCGCRSADERGPAALIVLGALGLLRRRRARA
ncbi:MAG: DUF11 domain-containing protein [Myxococcales bacterium]|nr:DUF11 domain-containing protein [Myxococcales bacterium]